MEEVKKNLNKMFCDSSIELSTSKIIHDIKSPLAAVKLIANKYNLNEEHKDLFESSIKRINYLINSLNDQYAVNSSFVGFDRIINSIYKVIKQKKIEYKDTKINFKVINDQCGLYPCLDICIFELQNIVSNLINNSIESFYCKDKFNSIIDVTVSIDNCQLTIKIVDNGCGIDEKILASITSKNFSSGKLSQSIEAHSSKKGNGLFYANKYIHQAGGKLIITTKRYQFTKVTVVFQGLPKSIADKL